MKLWNRRGSFQVVAYPVTGGYNARQTIKRIFKSWNKCLDFVDKLRKEHPELKIKVKDVA